MAAGSLTSYFNPKIFLEYVVQVVRAREWKNYASGLTDDDRKRLDAIASAELVLSDGRTGKYRVPGHTAIDHLHLTSSPSSFLEVPISSTTKVLVARACVKDLARSNNFYFNNEAIQPTPVEGQGELFRKIYNALRRDPETLKVVTEAASQNATIALQTHITDEFVEEYGMDPILGEPKVEMHLNITRGKPVIISTISGKIYYKVDPDGVPHSVDPPLPYSGKIKINPVKGEITYSAKLGE